MVIQGNLFQITRELTRFGFGIRPSATISSKSVELTPT
jgi:hypothetical protein